jgi:hypothetical protein
MASSYAGSKWCGGLRLGDIAFRYATMIFGVTDCGCAYVVQASALRRRRKKRACGAREDLAWRCGVTADW